MEGAAAAKAGGDKPSERTRLRERHHEGERKQVEEQVITAEYKFFSIATESEALRGELGATRRTRHGHERGREEAFRQKGFQSQKSLTVKSRKCKLLFTLEM